MATPTGTFALSGTDNTLLPAGQVGGGRAAPPKVPAKKKTATIRRLPAPQLTPRAEAMGMFRNTLQQIRALQKPVDTALIAKPYDTAQVALGQLGQNWSQQSLASGQAAQDQYQSARAEAQAATAAAGAGAGAPVSATVDPGSGLIAQQTQANALAATQAASAWQQLLEQTKAQSIYKAQLDRSNQDYGVAQQLAGNIPTWQQNIEQSRFQQDTARKNFALALGTAKDKQTNALRNYILDVQKQGATEDYQSALVDLGNRRAAATEAANTARTAHWGQVEQRMNAQAKAKGFSSADVSQILKTLKGPAGSAGAKKLTGYTVTRIMTDPSIGQIPGTQFTFTAAVPHPEMPSGWEQVGTGAPKYASAGGGGAQKFSWSRYKAAANLAKTMAAQRGQTLTDADVRGLLGPTPKTGKKK